jgi:hypothetical protein
MANEPISADKSNQMKKPHYGADIPALGRFSACYFGKDGV